MKKPVTVEIPMTPYFIKIGEEYVSIKDFSDVELRAIGCEWTKRLVKSAQNKRAMILNRPIDN